MTATKTKPAKAAESTKLPPGLAVRLPHYDLQPIALDTVEPDPENPRAQVSSAEVEDLAASIRRHGLLSPLVVVEDWPTPGRARLLCGHRRFRALLDIGVTQADAYRLDRETGIALQGVLQLVENGQRVDLDPVLESEAIAKLLTRPGWDVAAVAGQLGRSEDYVRERLVLCDLSPAWREARAKGPKLGKNRRPVYGVLNVKSWPMRWLREIALLSTGAQDELLKDQEYGGPQSFEDVRDEVRRRMHELGSAPFPLDVALIAPGCLACTACPKHSLASPGLFEDLVPADGLKKALCRDASCFEAKIQAHTRTRLEAVRTKHPETKLAVITNERSPTSKGKGEPAPFADVKGVKVLRPHEVTKAKKGEKGAMLAVRDHGSGQNAEWVKPRGAGDSAVSRTAGTKVKASTPTKVTLKERRAQLDARRSLAAARECLEVLEKCSVEPGKLIRNPEHLLSVLGAFGANVEAERHDPASARAQSKKPDAPLAELAFDGAVHRIREALKYPKMSNPAGWAELALDLWPVGMTWAKLHKAAVDEIPEPKSWATEAADTKAKGKAAAKPAANGKGKRNPSTKPNVFTPAKAAASPKSKATRKGRAKGQAAAANDDTADEEPTPGPAASRFYPLDAMVARERRDACPACGAPVVWHRVESGADVALDVTRQVEVLEAAGRSLLFERHAPHCQPRPRWTDNLRASTSRAVST